MSLTRQDVYLRTGDSVDVEAEVKDNGGNVLPANGATWATLDATIAEVRMDTVVVPGNYFTRGFIRAVHPTGGWTLVTVTVGNVADTVRVVVLPAGLVASQVTLTGAALADTVHIPGTLGPPVVAARDSAYTAPDTLVVNGTSVLNFDTSKVSAYAASPAGSVPGFVVAKTPTQIKVVFTVPAYGKVIVKGLELVSGNANVGTIAIDSLVTAPTLLSRFRFGGSFGGTIGQVGDTMTVTAGANQSVASGTSVRFGSAAAIVLTRTTGASGSVVVLSPAAFSGQVTVTGLQLLGGPGVATVTLDSMKTNAGAPYSINAATFPGVVTNGAGRLLDTIRLYSTASLKFTATGTTPSQVVIQGGRTGTAANYNAFVIGRTADTMAVISRVGNALPITVTNLVVGGSVKIPQLNTPGNITVDATNTGELNEPGNQSSATATVLPITGAGADTVYGAMNDGASDSRDYYTFTLAAATTGISVNLAFPGNGSGDSNNPDFDVVVCAALSASLACTYTQDQIPSNAASATNEPEAGTTGAEPIGQYWIRTYAYSTTNGNVAYRLIVTVK